MIFPRPDSPLPKLRPALRSGHRWPSPPLRSCPLFRCCPVVPGRGAPDGCRKVSRPDVAVRSPTRRGRGRVGGCRRFGVRVLPWVCRQAVSTVCPLKLGNSRDGAAVGGQRGRRPYLRTDQLALHTPVAAIRSDRSPGSRRVRTGDAPVVLAVDFHGTGTPVDHLPSPVRPTPRLGRALPCPSPEQGGRLANGVAAVSDRVKEERRNGN